MIYYCYSYSYSGSSKTVERQGRKATGLKPIGHDSQVAEYGGVYFNIQSRKKANLSERRGRKAKGLQPIWLRQPGCREQRYGFKPASQTVEQVFLMVIAA